MSVIVFFVTSDCWSLQWGKANWIQFTPVFNKRDCPLVWKLVETVNASQDRYNIPLWWNNLYRHKQIICLCQADSASRLYAKEFTFDKSSSIKYKLDYFAKKLANLNGNTFSFIPHVCYFSFHHSIAASKTRSWTTLFSTKIRGEETQSQEHQHPCLSNL